MKKKIPVTDRKDWSKAKPIDSRPRVNQLCDRYLNEHATFKKTFNNDKNIIGKHIRPWLGTIFVEEVKYEHIDRLHTALRDTPYQANRMLSLLSKMFNLAERWEWRAQGTNPCRHVERFPEQQRRRYLKPDEFKSLITQIELHYDENPLAYAAILLLIYTGARKSEIMTAHWEWIHGDRLELPDSKTGQRTITLTPDAIEVLTRLTPVPHRPYIIGPDISIRYMWDKLLKQSGIKALHVHDLRHFYASIGVAAGLSLRQIGGLLGHSSPTTTQRYAHLVESEAQKAANAIAAQMKTTLAK